MKKIMILLLITALAFANCSCFFEAEEEESILDALKISAWVLDEELEGTGYWAYEKLANGHGYWVSNDGKEVDSDSVFVYEQLEVGKPRVCAPLGYNHSHNLLIFLDFEGTVQVETDDPSDTTLRLAYSLSDPMNPSLGNWTEENAFRARAPMAVGVCPTGNFTNAGRIVTSDTPVDYEYYINVTAYEEDNTPLIMARIKLTVLEDPHYPYREVSFWSKSPNEVRSRFLSIELVEYEFSDVYKFDMELVETE
ncbi:MAG: hypothetical protein E7632_03560 [Ruminococcaceae bacterium]|nr:hypothetical protein [Oscillospiraceae bacterium]